MRLSHIHAVGASFSTTDFAHATLHRMLSRHEHKTLVWVDLETPTKSEVEHVMDEFKIHHLIGEELLLPTAKPRVEFFSDYVYAILHFPALRHTHKSVEQEIDFVVGRSFIITTHYDTIDPLHNFSKVFEVNSILDRSHLEEHAGFVFFYMLKRLYKAVEHEVDFVKSDLSHIEKYLFSGKEVDLVTLLSRSAHDLLNLRQTIEPHRDVLHSLEQDGARFFGDEFQPYLKALSNEYYRVHNHVMRLTEILHELRETNNSLLSTKENETMRTLTLMALFTFPLALMVSVLQVNSVHNPILGLKYDFWIIVAITVLTGVGMLLYFKHKKWL